MNNKVTHTPEPWIFHEEEMKIKGSGDINGLTVIANLSPKMDYSRGKTTQIANAQRIVECVNACANQNIEDVKKAKLYKNAFEEIFEKTPIDQALKNVNYFKNRLNVIKGIIYDKTLAAQLIDDRDQLKNNLDNAMDALKDIIESTTMDFAANNGFYEQRKKASEVYDRIKYPSKKASP